MNSYMLYHKYNFKLIFLVPGLLVPTMVVPTESNLLSMLSASPVPEVITLGSVHCWLVEESWRQRRRHLLCLRKKKSYSKIDLIEGKTKT